MNYPICPGCGGKGTVNWSSRYASKEPMSGEIRDERNSVCGGCHGKGIVHFAAPIFWDISLEEYHERFG